MHAAWSFDGAKAFEQFSRWLLPRPLAPLAPVYIYATTLLLGLNVYASFISAPR